MINEILEELEKAVVECNGQKATSWARRVVEEGIDPLEALNALTKGIKHVGDGYGRGELWLPDLIGAADAMSNAMPIIEEEIRRKGKKGKET